MTRIQPSGPDEDETVISLRVESPNLSLEEARDIARNKARDIASDAMMLSWYNGKTGEFYPDYDCGGSDEPPWRVFARSRGGNLTIDINGGEYVFIFLKL